MSIEPQMFVSGGFYITRSIQRLDHMNPQLLPDRVVTASPCITKFLPDAWCIEWTNDSTPQRIAAADYFGLDEHQLCSLIPELTAAFESSFGWPNAMQDLKFAQSIVNSFLFDTPDIQILELGLHKEYVEVFCQNAEPEQHPGFAPVGHHGLHDAILKMQSVTETGRVLGFEPLLWSDALSCSWLCNGLETAVADHLQIFPNANGLIDTFVEAQATVSYIRRDDTGAEPGLWLPWLVIDHTRPAE